MTFYYIGSHLSVICDYYQLSVQTSIDRHYPPPLCAKKDHAIYVDQYFCSFYFKFLKNRSAKYAQKNKLKKKQK